jgi:hypothetical protein
LLALDLGTSTGWALRNPDGRIVSGTESFKPGRFEGGGMRYLRFKRWLTELKGTTEGLGAVYFEEVRRHAGVDAAHVYGGFLATLTAWCEHHKIPHSGVSIGTIKRHATGKGNASKDQMLAAMRAAGLAPVDATDADDLAERLHPRDVLADDRRLCVECGCLAGHASTAWRCRSPRAAQSGPALPVELVTLLQRCSGFREASP